MATSNPVISKTASKLVDADTSFFLSLPWRNGIVILWATTDTPGVEPTIETWHPLRGRDSDKLNRDIIGNDLEIWARCPAGSVTVALD